MVESRYRWDFIGLSTDVKPTPTTSSRVVDGSTYYCSDTSKLYVWCKDNWYERKPLGGDSGTSDFDELTNRPSYGGTTMTGETNIPEITVSQSTGDSETDVMSQNATTSMIFKDPTTKQKIRIGSGTVYTVGSNAIGIGTSVKADSDGSIAIGDSPEATANSSTAIGNQAKANGQHSISIGHGTEATTLSAIALGGQTSSGFQTKATGEGAIAISAGSTTSSGKYAVGIGGWGVSASGKGSVALGTYASATAQGEMNIGSTSTNYGYNASNYRLLSGVYDGQGAHDAVTVGQVNGLIDALNTALSINIPHIGA